jgi:hypothetical protein
VLCRIRVPAIVPLGARPVTLREERIGLKYTAAVGDEISCMRRLLLRFWAARYSVGVPGSDRDTTTVPFGADELTADPGRTV